MKYIMPDGIYEGKQSGHEVEISTLGIWFKTEYGLRGINIPVVITVKNNEAKVEIKNGLERL
jgi:hypothetical protein